MAIRTPHWAPAGTYPTTKGWVTPRGEVVKKQKISEAEIAEWHGNGALPKQTLHEAPVVEQVITQEITDFHYNNVNLEEEERDEEEW